MRLATCAISSIFTLFLRYALAASASIDSQAALPVVIWHGLGDRYDSPGLVELVKDLKSEFGQDTFVYIARSTDDGGQDQKATLFANMNTQLEAVADRLQDMPELREGFNAVGLSQGGIYLRGYVERYNLNPAYPAIKTLVTLGSPHIGISSAPPCGPTEFFCKAAQLALRAGAWTPYAQSSVVPAQYFRNQAAINDYLSHHSFLRDINNERQNDTQPVSGAAQDSADHAAPRNVSYSKAIKGLENFVLFAFSHEMTVIPHTSPHFTLPAADNTKRPLPWSDLPLYKEDYIGIRSLHEKGRLHKRFCKGQHMQINDKCWSDVMSWLKPRPAEPDTPRLILQT